MNIKQAKQRFTELREFTIMADKPKKNYSLPPMKMSDWRVTQKYIRIQHNKAVVEYFKDKFQEIEVKPTYCKYFTKGQQNLKPDWTLFLN
jgi:hypothetical protein